MTKIGINNPAEVVSRTSVATAQASVLFVNSVETCHFCKKPGRNASNPFLKLSEMSATNLYLELLNKCCNSPGPFFTPGPRKLKIVRIHPIHPRVATIGCPFFKELNAEPKHDVFFLQKKFYQLNSESWKQHIYVGLILMPLYWVVSGFFPKL